MLKAEEIDDSQLILVSIGSVLIDAFDYPPESSSFHTPPSIANRPPTVPLPLARIQHPTPQPSHAKSRIQVTTTTIPTTTTTPSSTLPTPPHTPSTSTPSTPTSTTTSTNTTSSPSLTPSLPNRASTPQLDFSAYPPAPDNPYEQLGGGALYSLIGSRIWLPSTAMRTLVDRAVGGKDVSAKQVEMLEGYGKGIWCWNEEEGTRMTRARIRYEGSTRIFQNIVKTPHRTFETLLNSPLRNAKYLHISPPFSSQDLYSLLSEIKASPDPWRPKIIFEPSPQSCHPGQREWLEKIAGDVHVLSPNHEELLSLYSKPNIHLDDPVFHETIEEIINHLLHKVGVGGMVVIRCARMGSVVGTKNGGIRWFPAYFGVGEEGRVIDVTGGGNAYLGGYAAGLHLSNGDPYEAALYGAVSASFVIEQMGLPRLRDKDGTWNGEEPLQRLERLRKRIPQLGNEASI